MTELYSKKKCRPFIEGQSVSVGHEENVDTLLIFDGMLGVDRLMDEVESTDLTRLVNMLAALKSYRYRYHIYKYQDNDFDYKKTRNYRTIFAETI